MRCPVCSAEATPRHPAIVAPWIVELVLTSLPAVLLSSWAECPRCELRFSEERHDEGAAESLYSYYRGERYFRTRNAWEPWYTRAVNDAPGSDEVEIRSRVQALDEMLARLGLRPSSVLDFGGDQGQYLPTCAAARFVYELSNALPVEGVTKLTAEDLVAGDEPPFQLVMACHVLEHVEEPVELLEDVKRLVAPGGHVYLEVPLERARFTWGLPHGVLRWLRARPALFKAVDFVSTALRVKLGLAVGLLKVSEHINQFHERSLLAACERAGLAVRYLDTMPVRSSSGVSRVVRCLARRVA